MEKMDIDKAKVLAFVDEFVKTSERTAIKNKIKPLIAEVNEFAELVDIMSDVLTVRSKTPAKTESK